MHKRNSVTGLFTANSVLDPLPIMPHASSDITGPNSTVLLCERYKSHKYITHEHHPKISDMVEMLVGMYVFWFCQNLAAAG